MKKALFVSSRSLYPLIGGEKIRTAQSLKFLSQLFNVDVICESDEKDFDLGPLTKYINNYFHVYVPKYISYIWTLRFLFNKDPLQVNYYYSPKIQRLIDKIIDNYDVIFCNNIRTAKYFIKHKKSIRYIDFVDSIAMNYMRAKNESRGLNKLIYNIDSKRCMMYEKLLHKEFDNCSVISTIDRSYILSNSNINKNIKIIYNSVMIPQTKDIKKIPYTISFVGKMSYEPNITAVTNFAKNIFPIIKEVYPNAKFFIVGANPSKEVCSLHNGDIIVTGFVNEVESYMKQSSIIVAPMLTGAGIQNKILQAMALKCCVVTTTIGAEGLFINNNEIAIVNGNKKIASTIIELLNDEIKQKSMGESAYKYILNNFSEKKIFEDFKEFINFE